MNAEKNINIELLRIICIIMVIFVHVYSELLLDNVYILYQVIFVPAFFKVCVPCFFMIVGYLFSIKKNLKKFWIKNIFRIILPSIILLIFCELLVDFLDSNVSLIYYIKNLNINLEFLKNLFLTDILKAKGYHLWYIYVLIQLYLLYPIFKIICLKENVKIQKYLIILLFFFGILVYTVTNLNIYDNEVNFNFINSCSYSILYFLIGYSLKENISKIKIKNYIFLLIYFFMIFLSMLCARKFELGTNKNLLFLTSFGYSSIFIFFAAIAFFIFIMRLELKPNKIILFFGKRTLVVYYIHVIFVYIILNYSLVNNLYLNNAFLYSSVVVIICYLMSIICSLIFDFILKIIMNLFISFKNKKLK